MAEFIIGKVKGDDGKHLCVDAVFNRVESLPTPTEVMKGRHVYVGEVSPRVVYSCDGATWHEQGYLLDRPQGQRTQFVFNLSTFESIIPPEPYYHYVNFVYAFLKAELGINYIPTGLSAVLRIGDISLQFNEFVDKKDEFLPTAELYRVSEIAEGQYLTDNFIKEISITCVLIGEADAVEFYDMAIKTEFKFFEVANVDKQAFYDALPPMSLEINFEVQ